MNKEDLAAFIDHTCLKPEAQEADIRKLCEEAVEWSFYSVCIEAQWIPLAKEILNKTLVKVVTVIDFPKGENNPAKKITDMQSALAAGADEIDFVLNRKPLKERSFEKVLDEFVKYKEVCVAPIKVILETSELTDAEKSIACSLAKIAGFAFVKTSTGFSKSGATTQDVKLMRSIVGPTMGVKASGGIRSFDQAIQMIESGASRLGTSSSVQIVQGLGGSGGY